MVSALASSWPSPPELETPRKKEESLKALKALVRDWDLFSRGWPFCWEAGCSSPGAWASAGAPAASAGFCSAEGEAGLVWAGDGTLAGDSVAAAASEA